MNTLYTPPVSSTATRYGKLNIDGVQIAYREAGDASAPKLVLLHGFPSSSHQYRNLVAGLADKFHVIAPDYPGFGNSDAPDPAGFSYTFDHLAEITAEFLKQKGFDRFGLYAQDYGGPIGFRLVSQNPDCLEWLIVQNTNADVVGFTEAWGALRNQLWKGRTPESEAAVTGLLSMETTQAIYLSGSTHPELISPDNWNSDFFTTLQRPHAQRIQLDLFYDYRTNVSLYPAWQEWLKTKQPKTIIFWGQDDIFFTPAGGEAYLTYVPRAEMHRLRAGHFAVEDCLTYIVENMRRFYDEVVSGA